MRAGGTVVGVPALIDRVAGVIAGRWMSTGPRAHPLKTDRERPASGRVRCILDADRAPPGWRSGPQWK